MPNPWSEEELEALKKIAQMKEWTGTKEFSEAAATVLMKRPPSAIMDKAHHISLKIKLTPAIDLDALTKLGEPI